MNFEAQALREIVIQQRELEKKLAHHESEINAHGKAARECKDKLNELYSEEYRLWQEFKKESNE